MAKVRFLQSVYLVSHNLSMNFNDELDIEDKNQVDRLVKKGFVDVLKEEPTKKPVTKRTPRKKKVEKPKETKAVENGDD